MGELRKFPGNRKNLVSSNKGGEKGESQDEWCCWGDREAKLGCEVKPAGHHDEQSFKLWSGAKKSAVLKLNSTISSRICQFLRAFEWYKWFGALNFDFFLRLWFSSETAKNHCYDVTSCSNCNFTLIDSTILYKSVLCQRWNLNLIVWELKIAIFGKSQANSIFLRALTTPPPTLCIFPERVVKSSLP